jgi:hypothetical protein
MFSVDLIVLIIEDTWPERGYCGKWVVTAFLQGFFGTCGDTTTLISILAGLRKFSGGKAVLSCHEAALSPEHAGYRSTWVVCSQAGEGRSRGTMNISTSCPLGAVKISEILR